MNWRRYKTDLLLFRGLMVWSVVAFSACTRNEQPKQPKPQVGLRYQVVHSWGVKGSAPGKFDGPQGVAPQQHRCKLPARLTGSVDCNGQALVRGPPDDPARGRPAQQ